MNSTLDNLHQLFLRDLDLLTQEITSYPTEASLWIVKGDIKNSGGNLCLHLCGNLQHFIGAVLGKDGYIRNRDAEFADKDIPKEILLGQIDATKSAISKTLEALSTSQLEAPYPIEVFGKPMTTEYFLIHLLTHLTYHRGQINYHRRILTS
ncbi:MAG: DinB family protein [Cyclobacteriaceae bacterium]